jgi:hypothetical protein
MIEGMSPMKRCLAAFAITTDLFAPIAQANDALEAKVRAYVAVFSLAKPAWKVGSYPGKNEVKIT